MKKYEIIFADLDGTLIDTLSGKTFPEGIWDMKIKFDVLDKIKEINPEYVLIVINQGGIEKGFINEWSFRHKLEYICAVINNYCGCETYARYCTRFGTFMFFYTIYKKEENTFKIVGVNDELYVTPQEAALAGIKNVLINKFI